MARKVERFEDLLAWQKGLDLTEIAYQLADRERLRRDFALRDQIHGSVISIPANIAEGFERGTRGEFHHFLSIAKASCAELRSHAYVAQRVGYIDASTLRHFLDEAEAVGRIIGKLRSTVAIQRRTPRT